MKQQYFDVHFISRFNAVNVQRLVRLFKYLVIQFQVNDVNLITK